MYSVLHICYIELLLFPNYVVYCCMLCHVFEEIFELKLIYLVLILQLADVKRVLLSV